MWGLVLSLFEKVGPLLAGPISQLVTGINLGQVFTTIASFLQKHWKTCLIAVLLALQTLTVYEWQHDHNLLKIEKVAHQADINSYKQAQKDAQDKVNTEKKQLQQESKVKADAADQNYSSLLTKYRANLLRYEAIKGNSSGSDSGQYIDSTESGNGPSSSSDIPATVTISGKDAEICAVNTARLQSVHDWAIHLEDKPNE